MSLETSTVPGGAGLLVLWGGAYPAEGLTELASFFDSFKHVFQIWEAGIMERVWHRCSYLKMMDCQKIAFNCLVF